MLELYLFGLTVHALMLALTVTLPWAIAGETLRDIALPVIVIYPLASVLLGLLMIDQRRRRRSEDALRESEERFTAFADHVPGRLWIRDRDLRYLYVNPQLAADLGRRESDLIGRAPEDLWEADVAAGARELCERALRGEVVDVTERWPDDESEYYRSLVFAVRGAGEAALLGGLMFDITEQHEAQEELERHAGRLRLTMEGAVLAMGNIVERRDPYTAGHERRVAELAVAIATRLGMSGGELDGLRLAALIHDVGKISVPAEILSKPGRLTENEFELIKVHAQAGHDVLQTIAFDQPVAGMVLQHHERLDGSGYPDGLRGDDILPGARVMAVADVYEAMISHRPYRPGLPTEAAVAELRDGAGVRYDPLAVEACLQTLDEGFAFTAVYGPELRRRRLQLRAEVLDLGGVPVAGGVLDAGVVLEEARVVGRRVADDVAVPDVEARLEVADQADARVDLLVAVQDLLVHPVAVLAGPASPGRTRCRWTSSSCRCSGGRGS